MSHVPDVYQSQLRVSLSRPRPDVDMVICTDTHLVEFRDKLVIRSQVLPYGHVTDLRIVISRTGDWRYLIWWSKEQKVVFLNGDTLETDKEYFGVKSFKVEDEKKNGIRLAVLCLTTGGSISTDGSIESNSDEDIDIMELSDEIEVEDSDSSFKTKIDNILELKQSHICEAIMSMKSSIETEEKMLEETLKSLYLECCLDSEVYITKNSLENHEVFDDEHQLRIDDHWIRISGEEKIVLGLNVNCLTQISNIGLQLVNPNNDSSVVEYEWSLLVLTSPGSLSSVTSLSSSQTAVLCSVLPLSACLSVDYLLASVSFTRENNACLTTDTVCVKLPQNIHLSGHQTLQLLPTDQDSEKFLLAMFMTGISTSLEIFTKLGSLMSLQQLLENNNFQSNHVLCSFVKIESPFKNTIVKINQLSSQRVILNILSKSEFDTTLFVRFLRSVIPLDARITRVNI